MLIDVTRVKTILEALKRSNLGAWNHLVVEMVVSRKKADAHPGRLQKSLRSPNCENMFAMYNSGS